MAENPEEKNKIDLGNILLPKKEGSTPASAARINAGKLLEQEQKATLTPKPQPSEKSLAPSSAKPEDFLKGVAAKEEKSTVQPLRTYKSDIESTVRQKNVSVVSIAAAEAERRTAASSAGPLSTPEPPPEGLSLSRIAMPALGIALVLGAVGLLAFAFVRPQSDSPLDENSFPPPPFIAVDDSVAGVIPKLGLSRQQLMQHLTDARESITLSLGLVAQIYIAQETEVPPGIETFGVQE